METGADRGGCWRSSRPSSVTSDNEATRRWCAAAASACIAPGPATATCSSPRSPAAGPRNLPWLLISGFGAHRLLAQEVGLHVLELADDDKGSGRAAARVRLAVAPLGDLSARQAARRAHRRARRAASQPHAVVRRYRSEPSPLVRNMNGSWRTGKLDAVLRGDFDLIAASQG